MSLELINEYNHSMSIDYLITQQPPKKERVMKKISGAWINKTKEGKMYMAGSLGDKRILIFKNDYKNNEKQPDYNIYLVDKNVDFVPSDAEPIPF